MMPDRREHLIHERFIRWAYEHARLHEDDIRTVLKNEFVRLLAPAVGGGRKALVRYELMP